MATLRLKGRAAPEGSPLPCHDLASLCAASLLQLRLGAGSWVIEPSISADEPVVIDEEQGSTASGLAQIIRRYVVAPQDAPDERAYLALATSRLTALVEHSLFSLPANYVQVTRPSYAAGLPLTSRFVLPGQLRLRAKERLEREGLWGLGGEVELDEAKERKRKQTVDTDLLNQAKLDEAERKERMKREFEKLRIIELAREILEPFSTLLGTKSFFYDQRPTTLDAVVFAHLSLLICLPLPTPTILTLLQTSYPALVSHTDRMRELLFDPHGDRSSWPVIVPAPPRDWSLILSSARQLLPASLSGNDPSGVRRRAGQKERDAIARRRLTWVAITSTGLLSFVLWQGIVKLPVSMEWMTSWMGGADIREEEERHED